MATIQELKRRLLNLRGKEVQIAVQSIEENSEVAKNLIAGQLAQGIKSTGEKSDFSYSPFTIASKKRKTGLAAVTSHLTNYDTGESYQNLYAKVKGSTLEFGTSSDKEEAISERMDGEAFKLAKENKEELIRQHVQKTFNKKIRKFLKL